MGRDSLYFGKRRKMFCHDLDLDWTMPIVEPVRASFIDYKL